MKVYIKKNNLQVELIRYRKKMLIYSRLPNAHQEVLNTNHFGAVSDSLDRLAAVSECMARGNKEERLAAVSECMASGNKEERLAAVSECMASGNKEERLAAVSECMASENKEE